MSEQRLRVAEANALFKAKDYEAALEMYRALARDSELWQRLLAPNIAACEKRLQSALAQAVAQVTDTLSHKGASVARPRVLIADFRYPRFDSSAGELATWGIIEIFRQLGHEVIFIPKESTPLDVPYVLRLRAMGVTCIEDVNYDSFGEHVLCHSRDISLAYIFRPDVAELCIPRIRTVNLEATIFYHAPDVYFRRERAQYLVESAEGGERPEQLKALDAVVLNEVRCAAAADHVVCVSDSDAEAMRFALADSKLNQSGVEPPDVSVFPILYLEGHGEVVSFETTRDLCFIGSSEHTPNRDAIRWFLANVWPQAHARHPDLMFRVIGKTDAAERAHYESFPNVEVLGWVDDIGAALKRFRASVAPLRYGAGIKGKVGTSLINGIPCIASRVAVEDMGLQEGEEILLAEQPEDYWDAIDLLMRDAGAWQRLSSQGAIRASQLYSSEATLRRFVRILNDCDALHPLAYGEFITRGAGDGVRRALGRKSQSAPLVSVIVPGFGNVEMTVACLTSIYFSSQAHERQDIEVIYADDHSAPEVRAAIAQKFPDVRITCTPRNQGFVQNANWGAAHASGKYLVLLNNDTIVLPGWLEGLLEVIEGVPSCYVAGSKLLYANGLIQEAGAGIWTDGRTCSMGRGIDGTGLPSTLPLYNYVREVDYVSFASVIIRRDFWEAQGGLDTAYGFGYFDDSDFCMRVREQGGIVVFAPNSEVLHNESATFSQRPKKQVGAEKAHNKLMFRDKWARALAADHACQEVASWDPGYAEATAMATASRHLLAPATQCDASGARQRHILYFSPFPSHPASHGNQTTIQKFAHFLQAEGHAVHFALLQSHMFTAVHAREMAEAWDSFDILSIPHFPSCDGKLIRYDGWYIPGLGEQIAQLCAKYAVDTVICSYVFQSRLLDYVPNHVLKILDTHDKFTDRYAILDGLGKPREFFSCTREEEGQYLSRADVALARRDEEAVFFDSISTARVYTVPHLEEKCYLPKGTQALREVGIVASCNLINLDIVVSFIRELIRQQPRGWPFKLLVAGEVLSLMNRDDAEHQAILAHPDVEFLGFVDDIRDFYLRVDMIVCPIMSGTGINVKTVQCLAYGVPLLATQHASKGVATDLADHQFLDVPGLVAHLLGGTFSADVLQRMAAASRDIYERFVDAGFGNFRHALDLRAVARRGVGSVVHTSLPQLGSRKAMRVERMNLRRQKLGRTYLLRKLRRQLEDFGPSYMNLNEGLPNVQSDGGIGFWFKFDQAVPGGVQYFLVIDGHPYVLHRSDDGLMLTTSVSQQHFSDERVLGLGMLSCFEWETVPPDGAGLGAEDFEFVKVVRH
ncbi:glycosyltransferase [Massilia sp. TS11]|uniref:glycosyltransferase n=1 Tax=Massilia sp. TS11 TaxID=2908003 RepID=UPI001EDBF040|nr:glycosyltransferase [Massilia sp. TS11]MCG2582826.1 glycosyltransferase [Massilia sp. TS11]